MLSQVLVVDEKLSVVTIKNFLLFGLCSGFLGGGFAHSSPHPIDTQRLQGLETSQARWSRWQIQQAELCPPLFRFFGGFVSVCLLFCRFMVSVLCIVLPSF